MIGVKEKALRCTSTLDAKHGVLPSVAEPVCVCVWYLLMRRMYQRLHKIDLEYYNLDIC